MRRRTLLPVAAVVLTAMAAPAAGAADRATVIAAHATDREEPVVSGLHIARRTGATRLRLSEDARLTLTLERCTAQRKGRCTSWTPVMRRVVDARAGERRLRVAPQDAGLHRFSVAPVDADGNRGRTVRREVPRDIA